MHGNSRLTLAVASAWCSRMRHDGPLMLKTIVRCIRTVKDR
jgi:hypothetical protein